MNRTPLLCALKSRFAQPLTFHLFPLQPPDVFATFDTNEDGFLTREQLRTYFNYVMQMLMSIREAVSFGPNAEAIEQYVEQCMEVGCEVAAPAPAPAFLLERMKHSHPVSTPGFLPSLTV
jgi:hypothetical protein